MADLVPEEAIGRAQYAAMGFDSIQDDDRPVDDAYLTEQMGAALAAAAPLILAAELTRLADEIGAAATLAHEGAGLPDGQAGLVAAATLSTAARLRRRASVLRGEGDRK